MEQEQLDRFNTRFKEEYDEWKGEMVHFTFMCLFICQAPATLGLLFGLGDVIPEWLAAILVILSGVLLSLLIVFVRKEFKQYKKEDINNMGIIVKAFNETMRANLELDTSGPVPCMVRRTPGTLVA